MSAIKSIRQIIEVTDWEKKWALAHFTLLTCSSIGEYYFTSCRKRHGLTLSHNFFKYSNGPVVGYQSKSENDYFGQTLAAELARNPLLAAELARELKERTDEIQAFIGRPMAELATQAAYTQFDHLYSDYLPPYIMVTRAANYLSAETQGPILETLRDVRFYTEPLYELVDEFFIRLLDYVARREQTDPETARLLTRNELLAYFETARLPEETSLRERKLCGLYFAAAEGQFVSDQESKLFEEQILPAAGERERELSGQTASPGKASGRVRIIFEPSKIHDFLPGDILITTMTRPAFVPLMELAGAIVTDAGGVLCHAAIVSRELGVPCVIGTQMATQLLKEGEIVEVDATHGIVRKLNPAS